MTVAEQPVRRSQRSRIVSTKSSQYTSDLSDIDNDIASAGEDEEVEQGVSEEEEEDDDDNDEDYGSTRKKRKSTSKRGNKNKKQDRYSKGKIPATVDEIEDFSENYLFQALSDPEISIRELATNWMEEFEASHPAALKALVNFVLRCCGCVLQVEEHDVVNSESAAETIGEIQQTFEKQQLHEYPLLTTNVKWKNFKANVLDFIAQVLVIANEKDILYDEEQNFMENILIWLSAISTSGLRPLRYCSTILLLTMETSLCQIVVKSSGAFDKQQRQFDIETRKLKELKDKLGNTKAAREKSKIEKDIGKVEKRLSQISSTVESFKSQKLVLEEYLKDISNTTFVHRYRDIDPKIRQECMIALGHWIDINPEHFFETSYLRYFGWILSDKDSNVRLEVVKSLLRLYKKALIVPGFRQFTERFKGKFIEMAIYDSDYNVRITTLSLLFEVIKVGFLEEEEILKITSLVFCDKRNKINLICGTDNKYFKLQHELAKIINLVQNDSTKEFKEKHKANILNSEKIIPLDLDEMIKYKELFQVLENSFQHFTESYSMLERESSRDPNLKFSQVFKMLYLLPAYSTPALFEFLFKYITFDLSSVELIDSTMKAKIELSSFDRELLFSFIYSISSIQLQDENTYHTNVLKSHHSHTKKKDTDTSSEMSEKDMISNKLASCLPQLFGTLKNDKTSLQTFVSTYLVLLTFSRKQHDSAKSDMLSTLAERILSVFKEYELSLDDTSLCTCFQKIFETLLESGNEIVGRNTKLLMDTLTADLSSELLYELKKKSDLDLVAPLLGCTNKILLIGKSVDITSSLEIEDKESGKSIIKYLCEKCLLNEDSKREEVGSLLFIFKLFSCYISWKIDNITRDKQQLLLSDNFVLSNDLKEIIPIFEIIKSFALEDELNDELKFESTIYLIDLLVTLKSFHINLSQKLKNLENDDKLADINTFFEINVPLDINLELEKCILRTFLVKEYQLSKFLDIQLDRDENEDVNFDTETETNLESDEDNELKQKIEKENSLCRFTYKALSLAKLNVLPSNILKRLSLNKEALDSILFKKLFEQDESTKVKVEAEPQLNDVVAQVNEEAVDVEMVI